MDKKHQNNINDNPIGLLDLTEPKNTGYIKKEEQWRENIEFKKEEE